jgi:V/A-type H+-transporting ATPase subunit D
MAVKFQYNKISLQEMQKQLKIRLDALPVLKFKEAILRAESEKAKKKMMEAEIVIANKIKEYAYMNILWAEFPQNVISVKEIKTSIKNIAGVRTKQFENIEFNLKPICFFNYPHWISDGIELLKDLIRLTAEKKLLLSTVEQIETSRKKTTQKVNLYEKVQMPGYEEAISKVKKFLNDEESLGKAVQKIMKKKILSI